MRKKLISICLSVVMVLSLCMPVCANEASVSTNAEKEVIYDAAIKKFEEQKENDKLLFNKVKTMSEGKNLAVAHTQKQNKLDTMAVDTYTYSQVIASYDDEELVANVSVSKITELPLNVANNSSYATMGGGQKKEYDFDDSISVYASVITYYNTKTAYDGFKLYNLYAVCVTNRVDDKSVSIVSQNLTYGAAGMQEDGTGGTENGVCSPTGSYRYYKTGFTKYFRDWTGTMRATYTLTLKRQSSYKWKLEVASVVY